MASNTGSRVRAVKTLTSGISMPAKPTLRRNGTGRNTIESRPTATVPPLNSTARPAVAMARRTASSFWWPPASSSRQRVTSSRE